MAGADLNRVKIDLDQAGIDMGHFKSEADEELHRVRSEAGKELDRVQSQLDEARLELHRVTSERDEVASSEFQNLSDLPVLWDMQLEVCCPLCMHACR